LEVARIDIGGQLAFLGQVMPEILEGGNDIGLVQIQLLRDARDQRLASLRLGW
jgi:hypothetical protein